MRGILWQGSHLRSSTGGLLEKTSYKVGRDVAITHLEGILFVHVVSTPLQACLPKGDPLISQCCLCRTPCLLEGDPLISQCSTNVGLGIAILSSLLDSDASSERVCASIQSLRQR